MLNRKFVSLFYDQCIFIWWSIFQQSHIISWRLMIWSVGRLDGRSVASVCNSFLKGRKVTLPNPCSYVRLDFVSYCEITYNPARNLLKSGGMFVSVCQEATMLVIRPHRTTASTNCGLVRWVYTKITWKTENAKLGNSGTRKGWYKRKVIVWGSAHHEVEEK